MKPPESKDVHALIEQLVGAARVVEIDDLPTLAKMHGWCTELAATDDSCADTAATLSRHLEELIIGSAEDAAAALRCVGELVADIAGEQATSPFMENAMAPTSEQNTTSDTGVIDQLLEQLGDLSRTVDQHDLTRLADEA